MNQTTQQPGSATDQAMAAELTKDRQLLREERRQLATIPAADLAAAPARMSFVPNSMGEALQLAKVMAASTFVPNHCRQNEGNCLAIIMQAGRWGMDPFAVANKAYFTKDGAPPAFESQLVNAVVNSSGALHGRLSIHLEGEGEKLRCTVTGYLKADPNNVKTKTQSIARVSVRNSPLWKSDPDQQLAYYTTRAWARLHCPEVLLGVYTPDEMEIDAGTAQSVSLAPPRRDQMQIQHDGKPTQVDEATARALDEGVDPKTGEVLTGRPEDKYGDQFDGSHNDERIVDWLERLKKAELAIDVNRVEGELNMIADELTDDQAGQVRAAIQEARERLGIAPTAK